MEQLVKELKRLDEKSKTLKTEMRNLKDRKEVLKEDLFEKMEAANLKEFGGIKLPVKREKIPKEVKKQKAMNLFRQHGANIADEDDFWKSFRETQKSYEKLP